MSIRWTQSALADLDAIEAYISRHSKRYAQGMVERIFERAAQLENRPLLGAVVPEYGDESIRELLAKPSKSLETRCHCARTSPRGAKLANGSPARPFAPSLPPSLHLTFAPSLHPSLAPSLRPSAAPSLRPLLPVPCSLCPTAVHQRNSFRGVR